MRKTYGFIDERGREEIESRLMRYLGSWPEGLSSDRMGAWIHSCTKNGGYSEREYQEGLKRLRDKGFIAIANKVWYVRNRSKTNS